MKEQAVNSWKLSGGNQHFIVSEKLIVDKIEAKKRKKKWM